MLAFAKTGRGERVVLVHGFTQTRETWAKTVAELNQTHEVIAIDAPNHGESSDISLNLESGAKAIGEVGGRATYLGYSLGARFCLTLALAEPQNVARLVLVSATAGIEDKQSRLDRIKSDEALATKIEQDGIEKFVDSWLSLPLFRGLSAETNQRDMRLKNSTIGLSSSLRLCGAGRQQPTWSRLRELTMPVLVIAGTNDQKYLALAKRLVSEIGNNAELVEIKNSGHTPHLEQPEIFLTHLKKFLSST